MSTVAVAKREDTRNLAWREDNVGSKLLQRMGWKDGQAVGKRQRNLDSSYAESEASSDKVSSEGIRVVRRKDGLGLGAKSSSLYEADQHHHVGHFSNLLTELQKHHGVDNKKKKKSKKTTSPLTLPTNKSTHHKIRQAKFVEKSEHDMKCIFGGSIDFPVFAAVEDATSNEKDSKKRKKEKVDKERKDKKKKRKKESSS
ncbi:hypothetical protein FisN_9Hu302 [Fistulifera solaris]|jgi:hypothetical protein|uniref:G-patch domain-containing protein n=1 Tax=Fistulifera solaris TaxID=1519565 RepID=A0A1Z5JB49_FISSO|nr:hypothetical protein FisN_9Hu302 [Fistulifera solaris]|eukprot:GAX11205.1 hypothetical protein FisN_9Hu302 [Fistulifera solaris]